MLKRLLVILLVILGGSLEASERPNILWLSTEDMSPHLGCYGDKFASTPNIDALAARGVLFENAFAPSPVCATCRSAIITGVYSTALGTHHMRSRVALPPEIRCFTEYLRAAGYYCTNNEKEDYNFQTPAAAWDDSSGKAHWRNRPRTDQPFFAVFNFTGTHESSVRGDEPKYSRTITSLPPGERHDPAALQLPPYYPDTPKARAHWARYYNTISALDRWVAQHLAELDEAGLADDTIVFFWSDHGAGLPRAKRWLYDSGLRVPLIVHVPERFRRHLPSQSEGRAAQLVSLIDLAPTVLQLASLPIPAYMQGQPFLGADLPPDRQYVYGSRDRMDESYDMARCVRDKNYKYIRNFMPWRPYAQYQSYGDNNDIMRELRRLQADGKLSPEQSLFFRQLRPVEELYDLDNDPHELNNLANSRSYEPVLKRMSAQLPVWMMSARDLGVVPEGLLERLVPPSGSRYGLYRKIGGEQQYRELLNAALAGSAAFANRPDDDPRWNAIGLSILHESEDAAVAYWGASVYALARMYGDDSLYQTLKTATSDVNHDPAVRIMAAELTLLAAGDDESMAAEAIDDLIALYESAPSTWDRVAAANVLDLAPNFDQFVAPKLKPINDRLSKEVRPGRRRDLEVINLSRWINRFSQRLK